MRPLWRSLMAAPHLPIVAYLAVIGWRAIAAGGIAPASMEHALPVWLVLLWTVAIAAGGTLATLGGLGSWTRTESSGLALLLVGAAIYGVVLAATQWPHSLTIILVSAAIVAMCAIRMRVLTLARRAREVAAEHTDEPDDAGREG